MATDKNRFSKRKNKKKTGITGTASNQRSATNSTGERRRNILVKITKKILKKILPKRLYSRLIGRVSNDIITLDSPDKSYNSIFLSDDEGSKMIVILNEKRRDSSASLLEDVRQISSTKDQDIFPPDQELPSQITISIKRNNAENAKELTQEIVKDFNSTKERDEQVQITKTEETTLDSELVGITISIQKQANLPQQREEQSLSDRLSVSVDQINNLSELKAKYEGVFKNTTPNNDTIKIDLKTNSDQLKLIQKERKELISKENPKQQELKRINEQLKADLPNRDNLILTKERLEADLLNDFDRQKDMLKKLKDNQNYLTKVDRIQKLGQENNSITPIGTLTPLIEKLKSDIGLIQEKREITSSERKAIIAQFNQSNRKKELGELVSEKHLKAMGSASKKYNYTISIRETGALSVKRIDQGAKPKPHTILEKSIKKSSINNAYGPDGDRIFKKLEGLDLLGFVGHWENSKLVGLRVDKFENTKINGKPVKQITDELDLKIESIIDKDTGKKVGDYIAIDLDDDSSIAKIQKLVEVKDHAKALYTGDYDMHETYKNNRQTAEGSTEKQIMIQRLNDAIANSQGNEFRTAEVHLDPETNLIHVDGQYAMFQHGDQATYRMNQLLEARKGKWEKDKESGKFTEEDLATRIGIEMASLVEPVATESDEPLAWVINGNWFVTRTIEEHDLLREEFGLTKPNTWQNNLVVRKRVEEVIADKPFPNYKPTPEKPTFKEFRAQRRKDLADKKPQITIV